ncbi:MAG: OsmC family protein [Leptospira sp.]|nr:OsmC family protein [Leptospira sp.]
MANLFNEDIVVTTHSEKYKTSIKAGNHTLIADEPLDLQGGDLGPMPTQLLAAALGSCTSITVRMYADRKEMSLDSVEVSLNIEKLSADHNKITRKLKLIGNLTEEQRERLFQVANACPVHKILSGQVDIETTWA